MSSKNLRKERIVEESDEEEPKIEKEPQRKSSKNVKNTSKPAKKEETSSDEEEEVNPPPPKEKASSSKEAKSSKESKKVPPKDVEKEEPSSEEETHSPPSKGISLKGNLTVSHGSEDDEKEKKKYTKLPEFEPRTFTFQFQGNREKMILIPYKKFSVALFCEKNVGLSYSNAFSTNGGIYNPRLRYDEKTNSSEGEKKRPGYIFQKEKVDQVVEMLEDICSGAIKPEGPGFVFQKIFNELKSKVKESTEGTKMETVKIEANNKKKDRLAVIWGNYDEIIQELGDECVVVALFRYGRIGIVMYSD